jgi:hypothetical protein
MAIEIEFPVAGSQSTWVEWTNPVPGQEDVSTIADILVCFSKTISESSITVDHFQLLDELSNEIPSAFNTIIYSQDYNELSKVLTLRLVTALSPLSNYILLIDGLYDPAGTTQDSVHAVSFMTDSLTETIAPVQTPDDSIMAEDHSLLDAQIVVSAATGISHVVSSIPTNGSYNLGTAYNDGIVTITMSDPIYSASVLVERHAIAIYETLWDIVTPTSATTRAGDDTKYDITLPEISAGVHFEAGYEYRVTVLSDTTLGTTSTNWALGYDHSVLFTGPLLPSYATISSVLMQYPSVSSYDVAIMLYISSAEAYALDSTIDEATPKRAATDFALYSALWRLSTRGSGAQKIALGDLSVDKGSSSAMSDLWRKYADDAWARLGDVGPKVVIKGSSAVSPFVTRNWT